MRRNGSAKLRGQVLMTLNFVTLASYGFMTPVSNYSNAVLIIDLIFTVGLLVLATPRNEIISCLLLLMGYYSYVLGLNDFLGLAYYDELTVVSTLSDLGLVVPDDINRYQLVYGLFKSVLVFFLLSWLPEDSGIDWQQMNPSGAGVAVLAVTGLLVADLIMVVVFGLGFFLVGARFLTVCLVLLLVFGQRSLKLNRLRSVLILGIVLASFLITRSRSGIAVVLLYYLCHIWRQASVAGFVGNLLRQRVLYGRYFVLAACSFLAVSLYGVYRGDNAKGFGIIEAIVSASRFETAGESGLVFLFGSHVASFRDSIVMPGGLSDTIMSKFNRIIPFFPGREEMMADRYVRSFFPAVYEVGGGWAFSSLAEWYLFGGWIGLICYAIGMALVIRWLARKAIDPLWRVTCLTVLLIFQRSESSLAGIIVLYYFVWAWVCRMAIYSLSRRN